MIVTRWNPSATGAIHCGHIYSLLVNERFAHDAGGKCYVRFDDISQAIRIEMEHPEHVKDIIESQIEIIKWLEIPVDGWSVESNTEREVKEKLKKYSNFIFADPYPHYLPQSIRMGSNWIPYPYTPYQTAERVILDSMLGVTHVIRGEEFLTEYSLYRYFCDIFDLQPPQLIFLPRLLSKTGDISKTNGGYTIAELRANGYTKEEIIKMLEKACLNWYANGWSLHNLKPNPKLEI